MSQRQQLVAKVQDVYVSLVSLRCWCLVVFRVTRYLCPCLLFCGVHPSIEVEVWSK